VQLVRRIAARILTTLLTLLFTGGVFTKLVGASQSMVELFEHGDLLAIGIVELAQGIAI
jgi:hypothetical protein